MTHFTRETFQKALEGPQIVMADFWAPWCMPCQMLGPLIEDLATKYEGRVVIGKVNTDEEMDLAMEYGIASIPSVIFFKDGREIRRIIGLGNPDEYSTFLDSQL